MTILAMRIQHKPVSKWKNCTF